MSQPVGPSPMVNASIQGTTHQVNLRDYLNVRIAPFLKKALHDSLDAEAQYPLQWLGEHLIQQSMIHEGNPDASQIRERFIYDHTPKPSKQAVETLPPPTGPHPTSQTSAPIASQQPPPQPQLTNGSTQPALTPTTAPSLDQTVRPDTEMSEAT